ncbi:MAG: hypothetical protein ABI068_05725 [Ktedonobacterales bacterium]
MNEQPQRYASYHYPPRYSPAGYQPEPHPAPSAVLTADPRLQAPRAQAAQLAQQVRQLQRPVAPRPLAIGGSKAGVGNAGGKAVKRLSKAQALAMAGRLKRWIVVGSLIVLSGMIGLVITHPVVSATSTSTSTTPTTSGSSSTTTSGGSSSTSSSSSSSSGGYVNSSGSLGSGSSSSSPSTATGVS